MLNQVEHNLLFLIRCLVVKPATDDLKGFYLSERKFGRETLKAISLKVDTEADSILIYRYHSNFLTFETML